ncbi:uncharacterized protein LOC124171448 [Ischnura elegans]|nr:uncharacterized protein LOC124171431 [Ischnura elegans]XP_046406581.1 uncharacterized protein LOC124171448 [Ischnura elegans]
MIIGQLQATLASVVEELSSISKKMSQVLANQACHQEQNTCDLTLIGTLPMKSMEGYDSLEEKLTDENFSRKFLKVLVSVGGKDARSAVNNVMRRVMDDDLASQFSYTGRLLSKENECLKKRTFKSSPLCNMVHLAVKKGFKDSTDDLIKDSISLWLQQAKHRSTRRK